MFDGDHLSACHLHLWMLYCAVYGLFSLPFVSEFSLCRETPVCYPQTVDAFHPYLTIRVSLVFKAGDIAVKDLQFVCGELSQANAEWCHSVCIGG